MHSPYPRLHFAVGEIMDKHELISDKNNFMTLLFIIKNFEYFILTRVPCLKVSLVNCCDANCNYNAVISGAEL